MGRRGIPVTEDQRWVFNRLAEDYGARPGYPEPLIERVLAISGGPGSVVADLGAGTGHLALPLATAGARVFAVEPARAMLHALTAHCPAGVVPVHAAAERTGLETACCGLVLVADAVQWLDAQRAGREVARILVPGGALAVVEARLADTPFLRALSKLITKSNFKARPAPTERRTHFFAAAGVARTVDERFHQAERLSSERLAAVLRSFSFVGPALGPAKLAELLSLADALAQAYGGAVWEREITLTWGARA